jgi:hypothetical protein
MWDNAEDKDALVRNVIFFVLCHVSLMVSNLGMLMKGLQRICSGLHTTATETTKTLLLGFGLMP